MHSKTFLIFEVIQSGSYSSDRRHASYTCNMTDTFPLLGNTLVSRMRDEQDIEGALNAVNDLIREDGAKLVYVKKTGDDKDGIGLFEYHIELQFDDEMSYSMFDLSWKGRKY